MSSIQFVEGLTGTIRVEEERICSLWLTVDLGHWSFLLLGPGLIPLVLLTLKTLHWNWKLYHWFPGSQDPRLWLELYHWLLGSPTQESVEEDRLRDSSSFIIMWTIERPIIDFTYIYIYYMYKYISYYRDCLQRVHKESAKLNTTKWLNWTEISYWFCFPREPWLTYFPKTGFFKIINKLIILIFGSYIFYIVLKTVLCRLSCFSFLSLSIKNSIHSIYYLHFKDDVFKMRRKDDGFKMRRN